MITISATTLMLIVLAIMGIAWFVGMLCGVNLREE